jgi:hypothetical protein
MHTTVPRYEYSILYYARALLTARSLDMQLHLIAFVSSLSAGTVLVHALTLIMCFPTHQSGPSGFPSL